MKRGPHGEASGTGGKGKGREREGTLPRGCPSQVFSQYNMLLDTTSFPGVATRPNECTPEIQDV